MKTFLWGISALILLAIFMGWSTYKSYKPAPPDLEVIVDKHAVKIKAVTYSFRKWGRTAVADANTEPALLVREDSPMEVNTSGRIELLFEKSPDSVTCYLWDMETGSLAYPGLEGLPLDIEQSNVSSGDYAMEIRAKWEDGYVLYYARIYVNED
ncbi:hypothetical protein [Mesobacillus jeotgali]|uniref:hypothetical protein n=1 Tax=Mesobacillus jeotgali TaxID=129985 RepID=UPI0009A7D628|nr:hypothetical protein [Mesobacillus jeotgali]